MLTLELYSSRRTIREWKEWGIERLLFTATLLSVCATAGIVLILLVEAIPFFQQVSLLEYLSGTQWTPLFFEKHFGVLPLLCGTFLTSFIALLIAVPAGVCSAVYLSEFARDSTREIVKPILEILAGIPTVVYGYFALVTVTPLLKNIIPELPPFNALSAGLVMGVMILPMVASLSEDALYVVPQGVREAGFALGATRFEVSWQLIVPAAFPGVIASIVLALSRAVGETMIVVIAAGLQPSLTLDPRSSVETMSAYIAQISMGDTPHGTLEYQTLFAVAATLFFITLLFNAVSISTQEWFHAKIGR